MMSDTVAFGRSHLDRASHELALAELFRHPTAAGQAREGGETNGW